MRRATLRPLFLACIWSSPQYARTCRTRRHAGARQCLRGMSRVQISSVQRRCSSRSAKRTREPRTAWALLRGLCTGCGSCSVLCRCRPWSWRLARAFAEVSLCRLWASRRGDGKRFRGNARGFSNSCPFKPAAVIITPNGHRLAHQRRSASAEVPPAQALPCGHCSASNESGRAPNGLTSN